MAERSFAWHQTGFQVDVAPGLPLPEPAASSDVQTQTLDALRQLADVAKQQLEFARQLLAVAQSGQLQRQAALQRWQKENPALARKCRKAMTIFEEVQKSFLQEMTNYIVENGEGLVDADFVLSEFADRFGARLMHLTGVTNLLQHLGTVEEVPGKGEQRP